MKFAIIQLFGLYLILNQVMDIISCEVCTIFGVEFLMQGNM